MKKSLTIFIGLLAALAVPARAEIRYVIHITVDGLRGDLLKGLMDNAPATYANFVRLRAEGACTFNARSDFDYSETIPNHCCIVTGRPVVTPAGTSNRGTGYTSNQYSGNATTGDSIHQLGAATYLYKVSTFDMVHDRGLSTALYAGKSRFNLLVHSYNATKGRADTVGADNGKNKIDVAAVAASDLTSSGAGGNLVNVKNALLAEINGGTLRNYSLVHFTDTDGGSTVGGHGNGWGSANWNNGVAGVDGYLGEILAALGAATNVNIRTQTAIILTADHGGGGGGSGPGATPDRNHGDASSALNYTVPVFLWGPGVPAGVEAHTLFANRADPAAGRPANSAATVQPLRNADTANIAMTMLGLPFVEGSWFVPVPAQPVNVVRRGAVVDVTWPAWLTGYVLETTENVAGGPWVKDLTVPVEENGMKKRTVPAAAAGKAFWRLAAPGP